MKHPLVIQHANQKSIIDDSEFLLLQYLDSITVTNHRFNYWRVHSGSFERIDFEAHSRSRSWAQGGDFPMKTAVGKKHAKQPLDEKTFKPIGICRLCGLNRPEDWSSMAALVHGWVCGPQASSMVRGFRCRCFRHL